ncbi:hypothetical protein FHS13_002565 [Nocardiopsis algeriensis]|uniref:Uncharacterized protein n=1 Tax=Nocardiopsis algeriensis TaxID=1478215 RepID=A0A841IWM5_9ACTN|nr:hypothetical protein [Nocardiopsis algeriensis]
MTELPGILLILSDEIIDLEDWRTALVAGDED